MFKYVRLGEEIMYNYDFKETHESIFKEARDVNIKIGNDIIKQYLY